MPGPYESFSPNLFISVIGPPRGRKRVTPLVRALSINSYVHSRWENRKRSYLAKRSIKIRNSQGSSLQCALESDLRTEGLSKRQYCQSSQESLGFEWDESDLTLLLR